MNNTLPYLIIAAVFISYFAFHSLMASLMVKQWAARHWPGLMPYYRLIFNALAIILSVPLAVLVVLYPGEPLWQWQGLGFYLTSALALLAVTGFIYSLNHYDLSEFWGTKQLKEGNQSVHDQEQFQISPFHRYVRHPWYFFGLVIIWTRDVSTVQLVVYLLVTAYFIYGSRLEEKKLMAYHGEVYKKYRQKVAGLFPLPWKILSREEAEQLLREYQQL